MAHSVKLELLKAWLLTHGQSHSVRLLSAGETADEQKILDRIRSAGPDREFSVYVLVAKISGSDVPVYVGKTDRLLERWRAHAKGIKDGAGLYSHWRRLLLDDKGRARYETMLIVVPSSRIIRPPIPEFPTTVGSVEYQLVGLISEAYPETFLNVEGRPR